MVQSYAHESNQNQMDSYVFIELQIIGTYVTNSITTVCIEFSVKCMRALVQITEWLKNRNRDSRKFPKLIFVLRVAHNCFFHLILILTKLGMFLCVKFQLNNNEIKINVIFWSTTEFLHGIKIYTVLKIQGLNIQTILFIWITA